MHHRRRAFGHILALAQFVDGNRGLVAVGDGPNDVLRPESVIAAEKHPRQGRLQADFVDHRHAPLVERDAAIFFDPGKGVFLADRDEHLVALEVLVGFPRGLEAAAPLGVVLRRDLFEGDAGELALCMGEFLRHEVVEDGNALVDRVLFLPGRGLHLVEAGTHDHFHVLAAQALAGAAAVHGGVAAAEDDHALGDFFDMPEGDAGEPIDADVNVLGPFLAPRDVDVAAARRARTDEYRVVAFGQQGLHAVHALAGAKLDAESEDVADFLVYDFLGQAKSWDLAANHAARFGFTVAHDDMITMRSQVARHGERCRAGADAGNALAVLFLRHHRQARADVVLVVGGDPLQATNRDRFPGRAGGRVLALLGRRVLDAAAAASRLARAGAGASANAGGYVRLPVDHVGVIVAACRDQADVFGNGGMGGAGPLTVYDFVKVLWRANIGRLQSVCSFYAPARPANIGSAMGSPRRAGFYSWRGRG